LPGLGVAHEVHSRESMKTWCLCLAFLSLVAAQPDGTAQLAIPEDLACQKGKHAAAWASVKQRIRTMLEETPGGMFNKIPGIVIKSTLDAAVADVQAVGGFDPSNREECGVGKLSIQLLSVALLEDPAAVAQTLQDLNVMASPLMTFLLDIPWVATALSGWPMFGILAQVSFNKVAVLNGFLNNDGIDGLADEVGKTYFKEMKAAAETSNLAEVAAATYKYLESPSQGEGGVIGPLTALAAQSAVQSHVQERLSLLQGLQQAMRKAVVTPTDYDFLLTTRWPLWSLIHISVDGFTEG